MSLRDLKMQEDNTSFCFLSSPGFSKNIPFLDMWLTFPTREQILRDKESGSSSSEGMMLGTRLHISPSSLLSELIYGFARAEPTRSEGTRCIFMRQFDWNKGCLAT